MSLDTYIPRRLDDTWKVGLWDIDVAIPFLFCLMLGFMGGTKLLLGMSVVAGVLVGRWISRMKADRHPAFLLHWLYWTFPSALTFRMRTTPPSSVRRFVG